MVRKKHPTNVLAWRSNLSSGSCEKNIGKLLSYSERVLLIDFFFLFSIVILCTFFFLSENAEIRICFMQTDCRGH